MGSAERPLLAQAQKEPPLPIRKRKIEFKNSLRRVILPRGSFVLNELRPNHRIVIVHSLFLNRMAEKSDGWPLSFICSLYSSAIIGSLAKDVSELKWREYAHTRGKEPLLASRDDLSCRLKLYQKMHSDQRLLLCLLMGTSSLADPNLSS